MAKLGWRERLAQRLLGLSSQDIEVIQGQKSITTGQTAPPWMDGQRVSSDWSTEHAIKEGYKATSVLYACIEVIADAAASVPLLVYRPSDDEGVQWEPDPDHPLQALIDRPNPFMTREVIVKRIAQHMLLGGNGLLSKMRFKTGPNRGLPAELWPISPDGVKPVKSRRDFIAHYEWFANGQEYQIQVEDILHFMQLDPGNPYWGIGSVQAIAMAVDTDRDAQKFQRVGMMNRGIVGGVLGFKMPLSKDQYEQARSHVDSGLRGADNARKILVLGNDAQYTAMGMTPEEMDFVSSRRLTREEIVQGMRVPPPMVGIYDQATLANIETSRKIFWLDRMLPFLNGIGSVFNHGLVPDFAESPEDLWIGFDVTNVDALQQNLQEKVTAYHTLVGSQVAPLAAARVVGLDLREEDIVERQAMPQGLIGGVAGREGVGSSVKGARPKSLEGQAPTWSEEAKTRYWRRRDEDRIAWENRTQKMFREQIDRDIKRLVEMVELGYDGEDGAREAIHQDEWHSLMLAVYRSGISFFAGRGYEILRGMMKRAASPEEIKEFERLTEEVDEIAEMVTAGGVRNITTTTWQQMNAAIRDTLRDSDGATLADIAKAVQGTLEGMSDQRAWTIARTEMGTISNFGNRIAAEGAADEFQATPLKFWITARDGRVRDSHEGMEDIGMLPLQMPYPNGLMYPGSVGGPAHEVINCRCVEGYEFEAQGLTEAEVSDLEATEMPDPSPAAPGPIDDYEPFSPTNERPEVRWGRVMDRAQNELHPKLTAVERDAMQFYTGGSGPFNHALRHGEYLIEKDEIQPRIDAIRAAMERPEARLPEDIPLYRAYDATNVLDIPKNVEKLVGTVLEDAAFSSTSFAKEKAEEFAQMAESPVMMTILARKGTKGLSMDGISFFPEEYEFLLPPGTRFRIISAEATPDPYHTDIRHLHLTVEIE